MKKIKVTAIAAIIVILLFFASLIILLYLGKFAYLFTQYSNGFSQIKFYSIKMGMSKKDVYQILGKPFVFTNRNLNCEMYTKANDMFNITDFFGWESFYICYDSKERVTKLGKQIFFN
jgi:hypothetical protein